MLKNVKIIATLSEVTGVKQPEENIIRLIEQLPLLSSGIFLSQLSTENVDEDIFKKALGDLYESFAIEIMNDESFPKFLRERVYKNIITESIS